MKTGKLSRRAALAAGLSGLLLPHVAWPQADEREVEGGIGGTGIVGVLTDFGSLIVAGQRVGTGRGTRFSDGFGSLSESDVHIGDSLTVEAGGARDDLVARRVHVTHPLVGRVSAISGDGRRLTVNGVPVLMPDRAHGFAQGDRVAVSGLWRGPQVVGSRLAPARGPADLVSGDVARGQGRLRIGPVEVRGTGMTALVAGSFATATGRYNDASGRLLVDRFDSQRFVGAAGPLARLSIEGYLDPIQTAPGYRIAGLGHSFERNLDLTPYADHRTLYSGRYTGRFAAQSAIILPEATAQRRRVLRQLSETASP